jgi:hypothetical protein
MSQSGLRTPTPTAIEETLIALGGRERPVSVSDIAEDLQARGVTDDQRRGDPTDTPRVREHYRY